MQSYEIERLISEAIDNRPTSTNAALNLYIHRNKLICGARAVMPKTAAFVTHISLSQLQNGFNQKEWKSLVEEVKEIAGPSQLSNQVANKTSGMVQNIRLNTNASNQINGEDRRREQRLPYRSSVLFAPGSDESFNQGRMRDISSGGMAFSHRSKHISLEPNQQLITRFDVPRFNADDSFDTISFERKASVRRINKIDNSLYNVAVEFAKPLSFKPAEQKS